MYNRLILKTLSVCMVFLLWPMFSFSANTCEQSTSKLTRVFQGAKHFVPFIGKGKQVNDDTLFAQLDLNLSLGTANRLSNLLQGWTLGDLKQTTREELVQQGLGEDTLVQVETALLKNYGVKLISLEKKDISVLGLSSHVVNKLRSAGKNTLKDLLAMTREDLLETPGLGKKSVDNIEQALTERKLSLKDDSAEKGPGILAQTTQKAKDASLAAGQGAMAGVRQAGRRVAHAGSTVGGRAKTAIEQTVHAGRSIGERIPFVGNKVQEVPETPIADLKLGLSVGATNRVNNILETQGVTTLLDLSQLRREELENMVGGDTLAQMETALLKDYGVKLTSVVESDISVLGLSSHAVSKLRSAGKNTLKDLLVMTREDLLETPGLGKKSVETIEEALNKHEPPLRDGLVEEGPGFVARTTQKARGVSVAAGQGAMAGVRQASRGMVHVGSAVKDGAKATVHSDVWARGAREMREGLSYIGKTAFSSVHGMFTRDSVDLDIPAADLRLNLNAGTANRVGNVFKKLGIQTLGDLLMYPAEGLRVQPGLGNSIVDQIMTALKKNYNVQMKESIQEFSVERLQLPEKVTQALVSMGADTIGVLTDFQKDEMMEIFEVTSETANDIEKALARFNLKFVEPEGTSEASSQTSQPPAQVQKPKVKPKKPAKAATKPKTAEVAEDASSQTSQPPAQAQKPEAKPKKPASTAVENTTASAKPRIFLKTPVNDVNFGLVGTVKVRFEDALEQAGIKTVRDFRNYTKEELEDLPGIGKKTVDRVITVLTKNGFSLKDENAPTTETKPAQAATAEPADTGTQGDASVRHVDGLVFRPTEPTADAQENASGETKQEQIRTALAKVQVSELNLALNEETQNIFNNKNIETIADLLQYTADDLLQAGVDLQTVEGIQTKLAEYDGGLFLGILAPTPEFGNPAWARYIAEQEAEIAQYTKISLETPVTDITFSFVGVISENNQDVLAQANIRTAGDFQNYKREDLEKLGLDGKIIARMARELAHNNIYFQGESGANFERITSPFI